jgi:hypothetical protein
MKHRLSFNRGSLLIAATVASAGHAEEKLEKILVGVVGLSVALAHASISRTLETETNCKDPEVKKISASSEGSLSIGVPRAHEYSR